MTNRLLAAALALAPLLAHAADAAAPKPAATAAKPAGPAAATTPADAKPAPKADAKTDAKAAAPKGEPKADPKLLAPPEAKQQAALPSGFLKVPLFSDLFADTPIAAVDDVVIPLRELSAALETSHKSHTSEKAGKKEFAALLDRMIDARLLAAEGLDMGLDELDDTKTAFDNFAENTKMAMLQLQVTADVKGDPADADRRYKDAVREWKVRSALFYAEADAAGAAKAIRGGKSYDDVVKGAIAEKKAQGGDEPGYVHEDKLLPAVVKVVKTTQVGKIADPLKVSGGFALVRVEDVRYPESAEARAQAESAAVLEKKKEALQKYYDDAVKRFAKVDKKLLDRLDFDSPKPGLAALRKDKRVLVSFKGAKPITVGELADTMSQDFYHGADQAAKDKRINKRKVRRLDAIVSKRIVEIEAKARGFEQSAEFRRKVSDYRTSVLFSRVIEKVIIPDARPTDDEVKAYYEANRANYKLPTFYKLQGIGFVTPKDAQAALDKLKSGTDFKWLKANADRQIPEGKRVVEIENSSTVSERGLPAELAKSLSTATVGDYRLFAPNDQYAYVVQVVERTPGTEQPLEEVQNDIANQVFVDKIAKAVAERAKKLRAYHNVQIFLTNIGD